MIRSEEIHIPPMGLPGILTIPDDAKALVLFAHGSGSSRFSPRNRAVAYALNEDGMATLLFDLLTEAEEADRANVFDIPLLADRLVQAVQWLSGQNQTSRLSLGIFGASTGAAAAQLGGQIGAVVSRGGRPDLAGDTLEKVGTPTLLIVGGADHVVIELNEEALRRLPGPKALKIIPGATHLFPEEGALEAVIEDASEWFRKFLGQVSGPENEMRKAALERLR